MVAVRGIVRLVAWCLTLAVTLTVLHRASVPAVAVDLTSREPADLLPLLLIGGRWVALGCAWYLAGATALSIVSALLSWRPLRQFEAAVTLPALRRLVRAGLGASLVVGLGLGPSTAAAASPGPPGASAEPAPLAELGERPVDEPVPDRSADGPESAPPRVAPPRVAPPAVVPTEVAPPAAAPRAAEPPIEPRSAADPADPAGDAADGAEAADAGTHEVVAGESFWSIAADLTADELGRTPEDGEVFERWIALIEANRDRLLVPDDPDLLLPGQQLRVPGGTT